jgi:hypothetical protein
VSALLLYGYACVALCLLTVALHDIGAWLDSRKAYAWIYRVTLDIEDPR